MGRFFSLLPFICLENRLWDLKHTVNSLWWKGTRYTHFIRSQLDRALSNCAWAEAFPASRCKYLRFEGSNHRPLLTYFNEATKKKRGFFRFDKRLREIDEIKSLIREVWNVSDTSSSVLTKLAHCRRRIIQWTKEHNLNSSKLISKKRYPGDIPLSHNSRSFVHHAHLH